MSSPLTERSPEPSFYTAHTSPANEAQSTNASSPVVAPAPSLVYRRARQLPRELKEHCQIYLEEQLCALLQLQRPSGLLSWRLANQVTR